MSFIGFIRSKVFWINLALAIVTSVVLISLLMWALTVYTRSGRTVIVPDLKGYTVRQIEDQLENVGLEYVVIDSMHKADAIPGAIVEQIPRSGKNVKKGRKIFLTINSFTQEMVAMPQLVDYSLRNARVVLETSGLVVGQVSYKPSAYHGLVLGQMVDGRQVKAGEKIAKGTKVQLIVGSGAGGNSVVVPELLGLTFAEAQMTLEDVQLKVGNKVYDNTVTSPSDSLTAVVFKQSPEGNAGQTINVGSSVSLWMTKDMDVVIDAMEEIENSKDKE